MKTNRLSTLIIVAILLAGIHACAPQVEPLHEGIWRGVLSVQGKEVPFNFSVEDDTAGTVKVFLLNGEERFALDSVTYQRDSVVVSIDVYDAQLVAKVHGDSLTGYFRKNQSGKQGVPIRAKHNQEFRFERTDTNEPRSDSNLSGNWSVILTNPGGSSRYSVGQFSQRGNGITGTLLTTTGDYRYLDGVVDGDSLRLSAFSGSNPTLLQAQILDSLHLKGEFLSPGGVTTFAAVRSDTAHLPDPYTLTYLKSGFDKLAFSFPDLSGKQITLADEKYKGKVVVLTIMGSWCPNCVDEAAFLAPWYKENKHRGIEIIGLSFERKDDLNFAKTRLDKFIRRFDITYDILFAGLADKKEASAKLPELNQVLSFPTTIIIDKNGKVRKIHTGFTGPATGQHYYDFVEHFNRDIDEALRDNITGL